MRVRMRVGCDMGRCRLLRSRLAAVRGVLEFFSSCLDGEVLRTVPPYWLIASTALPGRSSPASGTAPTCPLDRIAHLILDALSMLVLLSLPIRAPSPEPTAGRRPPRAGVTGWLDRRRCHRGLPCQARRALGMTAWALMPHPLRAVRGHRHPCQGDPARSGGIGGCRSGGDQRAGHSVY